MLAHELERRRSLRSRMDDRRHLPIEFRPLIRPTADKQVRGPVPVVVHGDLPGVGPVRSATAYQPAPTRQRSNPEKSSP